MQPSYALNIANCFLLLRSVNVNVFFLIISFISNLFVIHSLRIGINAT